jgi:hypothetical protein
MARAVKRTRRARTAKRVTKRRRIAAVAASDLVLADDIDLKDVLVEDDTGLPPRIQSGNHAFDRDLVRLLIRLRKKISKNAKKTLLDDFSLVEDDGKHHGGTAVLLRSDFHIWARTADARPVDEALLDAISKRNDVEDATSLYRRLDLPGARGLMAPKPNALILRRDVAARYREQLVKAGFKVDENLSRLLAGLIYLSGERSAIKLGAAIGAKNPELARAIAYDLIPYLSPFAVTPADPNDTLYNTLTGDDAELANRQWDMKRVGARWAWGAFPPGQPGDSAVTVFIFDQGVDLQHTDLMPVSQTNVTTTLNDPATFLPATSHGTELAGVVHGQHGNAGTSMAGVAPGCTLRSLRASAGANQFDISTGNIAVAIGFAQSAGGRNILLIGMDAGASVLTDGTVQTALGANTASLIVVASGNHTTVTTPTVDYISGGGTLTPRMLVAGGYEQTSNTDRNGRVLIRSGAIVGSKTGPEVCVSAPADGIITTTWVSGSSNQYTALTGLRGTSLAAAHAAGMAALAWSKLGVVAPDVVRTQLEQTCAKTGADRTYIVGAEPSRYRHEPGRPNGLWNEELGYGSIDASAVLVTTTAETDPSPTDTERARVIIRDNPTDNGVPEPSTGSLVTQCDIVVTTTAALLTTGATTAGSAADTAFTAQVLVAGASGLQEVSAASDYYVFVRVVNIGPAAARGIRVTACLAACATSFMYPSSWDNPTGAINVICQNDLPPSDLSYHAGPLPVNGIFIARLRVPAGAAFGGFGGHACCVARVTCANDVNFNRATISGGMAQRLFNNLAQRNLSIV